MTHFMERQRFTQWWIWVILLGTTVLFWHGAFQQLVLGQPWGNRPASDAVLLILWLFGGVLLPGMFLAIHLQTEVRQDGVYVRFAPFRRRFESWRFDEIFEIVPRDYSPLKEFGGWGIRAGPSGKAYTIRGHEGVQLVLRTGKRVLIGTQQPDRFMAAVARAKAAQK